MPMLRSKTPTTPSSSDHRSGKDGDLLLVDRRRRGGAGPLFRRARPDVEIVAAGKVARGGVAASSPGDGPAHARNPPRPLGAPPAWPRRSRPPRRPGFHRARRVGDGLAAQRQWPAPATTELATGGSALYAATEMPAISCPAVGADGRNRRPRRAARGEPRSAMACGAQSHRGAHATGRRRRTGGQPGAAEPQLPPPSCRRPCRRASPCWTPRGASPC